MARIYYTGTVRYTVINTLYCYVPQISLTRKFSTMVYSMATEQQRYHKNNFNRQLKYNKTHYYALARLDIRTPVRPYPRISVRGKRHFK